LNCEENGKLFQLPPNNRHGCKLSLSKTTITKGETLSVSVEVKNTGAIAGDEVV
jgi:hypothetical protein